MPSCWETWVAYILLGRLWSLWHRYPQHLSFWIYGQFLYVISSEMPFQKLVVVDVVPLMCMCLLSLTQQMAYDAHFLRVPKIQWLGVFPSEAEKYSIPSQCLLPLTSEGGYYPSDSSFTFFRIRMTFVGLWWKVGILESVTIWRTTSWYMNLRTETAFSVKSLLPYRWKESRGYSS